MRRVQSAGGFATIVRKGSDEAGAIHFIMRDRMGGVALFLPAPQSMSGSDHDETRSFIRSDTIRTEEDVSNFQISESRFDPDFWLVELDTGSNNPGDLFEVTTLPD